MARAHQPQTVELEQDEHEQVPAFEWGPHIPRGTLRVSHTSCCGLYEWAAEGGNFLVLRRVGNRYEETGRGLYRHALDVYIALVEQHQDWHRSRGERPEPDTLLPRERGRASQPEAFPGERP